MIIQKLINVPHIYFNLKSIGDFMDQYSILSMKINHSGTTLENYIDRLEILAMHAFN